MGPVPIPNPVETLKKFSAVKQRDLNSPQTLFDPGFLDAMRRLGTYPSGTLPYAMAAVDKHFDLTPDQRAAVKQFLTPAGGPDGAVSEARLNDAMRRLGQGQLWTMGTKTAKPQAPPSAQAQKPTSLPLSQKADWTPSSDPRHEQMLNDLWDQYFPFSRQDFYYALNHPNGQWVRIKGSTDSIPLAAAQRQVRARLGDEIASRGSMSPSDVEAQDEMDSATNFGRKSLTHRPTAQQAWSMIQGPLSGPLGFLSPSTMGTPQGRKISQGVLDHLGVPTDVNGLPLATVTGLFAPAIAEAAGPAVSAFLKQGPEVGEVFSNAFGKGSKLAGKAGASELDRIATGPGVQGKTVGQVLKENPHLDYAGVNAKGETEFRPKETNFKTANIDTPERQQLRVQTVKQYYMTANPKQERQATILIGGAGAGKSDVAAKTYEKGAVLVDPDTFRFMLPEAKLFPGWEDVTHQESSSMANDLMARAMSHGDNIVRPTLGGDYDKLTATISDLENHGYHVRVVFVDVPEDVAVTRNSGRVAGGGHDAGEANVRESNLKARQTYQKLKASQYGQEFWHLNNNVPQGTPPKVVEHFFRPRR